MEYKILAFGLMLIRQVKRIIWIQTDIYWVRSIADFELRTAKYWLLKIFKIFYM